MKKICYKPIGVVHSPFRSREDIEPMRNTRSRGFQNVRGEIEVFPPYEEGLKDISGFSHLIVLFVFHQSQAGRLLVRPPGQRSVRGVFATRSPHRPNPIGMTVVKLRKRRGNVLEISGLDIVEGSPVLDIKPYTPKDRKSSIRTGFLAPRKGRRRS